MSLPHPYRNLASLRRGYYHDRLALAFTQRKPARSVAVLGWVFAPRSCHRSAPGLGTPELLELMLRNSSPHLVSDGHPSNVSESNPDEPRRSSAAHCCSYSQASFLATDPENNSSLWKRRRLTLIVLKTPNRPEQCFKPLPCLILCASMAGSVCTPAICQVTLLPMVVFVCRKRWRSTSLRMQTSAPR